MAEKKHLTLNVDLEIANKAVADPNINVSEITEKVLSVFVTSSETGNKEKLYKNYQELFNLMLPLLKKFRVKVQVGEEEVDDPDAEPMFDHDGEFDGYDRPPLDILGIYLEPDGSFSHDAYPIKDISNIGITDFYRPQEIVDKFLLSIQEGVEYRKNQFKEIEMAKRIIDAITKPIISKTKKSTGKGKKK